MPEPKKNREDYNDDKNAEIGVQLHAQDMIGATDAIYDPTPKDITEHLEEIRNRLFLVLGLGVVIFITCFNYSEFFISLLEKQAPQGSSFFQFSKKLKCSFSLFQ